MEERNNIVSIWRWGLCAGFGIGVLGGFILGWLVFG